MKSHRLVCKALAGILSGVVVLSCGFKGPVKVACIGDSLTEGYGIPWQCDNSYPAVLDSLLGEGYNVMNFGRSATTVMKEGNFPYWSAKEFRNAINYHPDVVVLLLGSNDTKTFQWNEDKFEQSYRALVDTLLSLKPRPRLLLGLPIPALKDLWSISDSTIVNGVIPTVSQIATEYELETIDLYHEFEGREELYLEGIHPNLKGIPVMAEIVSKAIKNEK